MFKFTLQFTLNIEQYFIKILIKSKLTISKILGQDIGFARKSLNGFLGGDFVHFRSKVKEVLNYESFLSWEIILKLNFFFSTIGAIT